MAVIGTLVSGLAIGLIIFSVSCCLRKAFPRFYAYKCFENTEWAPEFDNSKINQKLFHHNSIPFWFGKKKKIWIQLFFVNFFFFQFPMILGLLFWFHSIFWSNSKDQNFNDFQMTIFGNLLVFCLFIFFVFFRCEIENSIPM